MKNKSFLAGIVGIMLIFGLVLAGCSQPTDDNGGNNSGGGDTAVTFNSLTADGSATQTTTQLTLTFSQAIIGLSANDIILSGVSGVNKGTLSGSGPGYTLPISGFTVSGALTVTVAKTGYVITGSPKTALIYYYNSNDVAVTLSNLTADGSAAQTTTQLTLTFSQAITGLSANDIILNGVNGVNKGTLNGSGPSYTLPISGFTSGGTLNVAAAKSGYTISGSPKTVPIYYYTNGGGGETESITLNSNGQWGWQAVYESDSLFSGNKITQGDEYTFTYSFTSDVPMDYLQIVLIDNGAQGNSYRWVELSDYKKVKENIAANTVVSGTVTITAAGTATDTTALANRLVFQAGTGTVNQPTLTFTILNIVNNGSNSGGGDIAVTFGSAAADGSPTQTTTQLTLTFDQVITDLSASDITLSGVSGVNKGTISGSGPSYTLLISGFTSGGTLNVAAAKSGYTISGSPKTATIYYYSGSGNGNGDTDVTFSGVTANGSATQTTTELTLTFSQTIIGLSADDITLSGVSGVNKGTISGSGPTYTLPISGFTSGGTLAIAVAKSGYAISGSPKTVTINYFAISDGSEENPFPLIEGTWKDGNITDSTSAVWYSLSVTSGTAYNVWVNQRDGGDGTKTMDTELAGSYADGTYIFGRSWANIRSPESFTADRNGIVKLKIYPYWNSTGTYAIGYSIDNTSVALNDIIADGSATESTTQLTLTFDKAIILNTNNITVSKVSGVTGDNTQVGPLIGSGNTYTLSIINFYSGGTLSIGITPKSGYTVNNSPKTVDIYYNGVSWTRIDSGYFFPNAIAYGNGRFVAVSNASKAAYSTNGTSWTEVTMSNTLTYTHVGIAYGYYRFVAVSTSGTMAESANGTSWSYMGGTATTFGTTRINSIVYGVGTSGGKFVAVGHSGKAAYATDSAVMGDWSAVNDMTFGTSNILDVTYGGSRFVAVGQSGKAAYSGDGITWTAVSDMKFGTSSIYGITYGNGKYVAVGQGGKAAYSSDGVTWTAVSDMKFGNSDIMNIAYGGGKFVVVGDGGKAAYSGDGITWTAVDYTAAGTGTIDDIAYGNGRFVSTTMAYWVTP
jgi:hypothetical protein